MIITNLGSSSLVVVLDLGAHADLADERRVFLAVLHQHQVPVPTAQVFRSPHEEHVSTARREPLSLPLLK